MDKERIERWKEKMLTGTMKIEERKEGKERKKAGRRNKKKV